jgi:hypothetical protein
MMTIEEYLKSIWKEEYIAKRNEYITQPNVDFFSKWIQLLDSANKLWDKEIEKWAKDVFNKWQLKTWYLHLSLLKITPVSKIKINKCTSVEEFNKYLRWDSPYLFASLLDDCLYPDDVNSSDENLELYLYNRNVYIKNWNIGDKNVQLAAYTKIQQTLINRSIDKLIQTTEKVSQESSDTSQDALLEAKKSNKTAKIALLIAWITWVASIVVGVLSYISSEKTDNSQIYTLSWINNQLVDIKTTIDSLSWSYKQSEIEDKLNQQIEILKKINSKK